MHDTLLKCLPATFDVRTRRIGHVKCARHVPIQLDLLNCVRCAQKYSDTFRLNPKMKKTTTRKYLHHQNKYADRQLHRYTYSSRINFFERIQAHILTRLDGV